MATYNYTVTASGNNHYLWNGHGLVDAQNPDLFLRAGDALNITNASGGHPMRITNDATSDSIDEGNDQKLNVGSALEGAFTYVCTSHAAMTGQITVSAAYANEGPEDGYGTGPLIGHDAGPLSMNEIRTKINEIISKGGVGGTPGTGGGSISVSENAPGSPSDGDLWWDEDTASLYVYFEDRDAWIQTNGAVGTSTAVNIDAEFSANAAHMAGGGGWFCFDDSAANITATIHTDDTNSLSTGNGSGTGTDRAAVFTVPDSGFYQINATIQLNVNTSTSITMLLHTGDTIPNASAENLAAAGQMAGENQETLNFSGARYLNAGDKLYFEYTNNSANVPALKGRLSIFKINAGGGASGGGDASIKVSATAPDPAEDGDLWFNTTQAELYVYVDAESAWIQTNGGGGSGGGNFDSGWLEVPDYSDAGDNYADLSISHTLGNKYPLVQVYIQDVSTGKEQNIGLQSDEWTVATDSGIHYNPIDSNTGTIRIFEKILGESAATPGELDYLNIVGNTAYRIKIVASAGGGGAGPRAHVVFDGRHPSDLTGSITSSSNVSSIEDKGVGQYEVNLASSISNPLLVSSPIGHHRQNYNDIVWHETHAIALPYGPNGNGITGGLGATTTSKIWVECNQPQTGGSQDAPVHLLVF